jgi:hypothetical protein
MMLFLFVDNYFNCLLTASNLVSAAILDGHLWCSSCKAMIVLPLKLDYAGFVWLGFFRRTNLMSTILQNVHSSLGVATLSLIYSSTRRLLLMRCLASGFFYKNSNSGFRQIF